MATRTPLPADVRLMNAVSNTVFALIALALLAAGVAALSRLPMFTLRAIKIDGEVTRSSLATIRANAAPQLAGNFFSLDLARGRAAFESVPWVRRAVVRRVWPDRLAVTLEEHHAAALWQGEDGDERLVNDRGEVFEANLGDVEDEGLPTFAGPDGSAAHLLGMHRRLVPALAPLDARIEALRLSNRGSWRVELDSGTPLELGRGSDDEVLAQVERFVRTVGQVTGHFRRPLEYADLRHSDGYAVRLRGITTGLPATPQRH